MRRGCSWPRWGEFLFDGFLITTPRLRTLPLRASCVETIPGQSEECTDGSSRSAANGVVNWRSDGGPLKEAEFVLQITACFAIPWILLLPSLGAQRVTPFDGGFWSRERQKKDKGTQEHRQVVRRKEHRIKSRDRRLLRDAARRKTVQTARSMARMAKTTKIATPVSITVFAKEGSAREDQCLPAVSLVCARRTAKASNS